VRDNPDTSSRTGTVSIGGRTYTVLQAGASAQGCVNSISPLFSAFSAAGGTGTLTVTAPPGCIWSATSNVDWVVITSSGAGAGNGAVDFSVGANTAVAARKGAIRVSTLTHNVKQKGN
jgi:hypothetical protein